METNQQYKKEHDITTFLLEFCKQNRIEESSKEQRILFIKLYEYMIEKKGKNFAKDKSFCSYEVRWDYNLNKAQMIKNAYETYKKKEKEKEDNCLYCNFLPSRKTKSIVKIKGQDFYLIKKDTRGKSTKTIQAYRMTDGRYMAFHWSKDELIVFLKKRLKER